MQRLDQVLRELQPVLKTLNDKSNALVFEAKDKKDPQPKEQNNEKWLIVAAAACALAACSSGKIKPTISFRQSGTKRRPP